VLFELSLIKDHKLYQTSQVLRLSKWCNRGPLFFIVYCVPSLGFGCRKLRDRGDVEAHDNQHPLTEHSLKCY